MSIFEEFFKLKKIDENEEKLKLLMEVTNNKMTLKETKRLYDILNQEVMQKMPKNMQIIESMDLLNDIKGNWLTREEKENFVASMWMFDTMDDKAKKKYLNLEQVKYVKQAVLGRDFKAASESKYYAEFKEYKYKY